MRKGIRNIIVSGLLFSLISVSSFAAPDPEKPIVALAVTDGLITLHAEHASFRDILKDLDDKAGIRITVFEGVPDREVTLDFHDLPVNAVGFIFERMDLKNFAVFYDKDQLVAFILPEGNDITEYVKGKEILALQSSNSPVKRPNEVTEKGAHDPQEFFYYAGGKKIFIKTSADEIAFRLAPGVDYRAVTKRLGSLSPFFVEEKSMGLPKEEVIIQKLPGRMTGSQRIDLLTIARADPSIIEAVPVFLYDETKLVPVGQLIVQFRENVQEQTIEKFLSDYQFRKIKVSEFRKNNYVVEMMQKDYHTLFDLSHELRSHEIIEYAEPNFLTILRPQSEEDAGQKIGTRDRSPAYGSGPAGNILPENLSNGGMLRSQDSGATKNAVTLAGPQAVASSWTSLLQEDFEGTFPSGAWAVHDADGGTNGEYYWGDTFEFVANRAAWPAERGANGYDWLPGTTYANNMSSWMVYGPFDLSDATFASFKFRFWAEIEPGDNNNTQPRDYLGVYASTDGTSFSGVNYWGDWTQTPGNQSGWLWKYFDFSNVDNLGDLTGQPQVYLAFHFYSDAAIAYQGVFIDDIQLNKITGFRGVDPISADPLSWQQWALNNTGQTKGISGADMKVGQAWSVTKGNPNIIIAIIDEGVDLSHEDLDLVPGYDATGNGSSGGYSGDDAHGTACAGVAAARGDNGRGISGVCPHCRIMPVRIAYKGPDGNWVTSTAEISDGILWAVNNQARVLSNSWTGTSPSDDITGAVQYARNSGAVLVFAAGNQNVSALSYPASLSEVIAVGAASPCDERKNPDSCDGETTWGSNYGDGLDVLAPGVLITTTDVHDGQGFSVNDYYSNFEGASAAAPHIAGLAGLILSLNPSLTPDQVQGIIQDSADDKGLPGWDAETGWGRVNAFEALTLASLTVVPIGEAVDETALTWATGGDANWIGQSVTTHDGVDAVRSGVIRDSQFSWIETTVSGAGTVSFWRKVSSQSSFDYLRFSIDGFEQTDSISGEVDWTQVSYAISGRGTHTLRWQYDKDGSVSSGLDAGWVDQIVWTATVNPDDGVCGASNGQIFTTKPLANLCSAGAPTAVSGSGLWTWSCTGSNDGITANCSAAIGFNLTVTKAGTGTGEVEPDTGMINFNGNSGLGIYISGATVVLTAIPSEHSNFTKWKGCMSVSDSTCTVLMTAARSVKAIYTADPKYALTVTKAGTGTGTITSDLAGVSCPGDCSKRYWKNDVVTLTAEPDASSMFSGWRGACTGTEKTCRVTLTAAMKVKATFIPFPALKVTKLGTGNGVIRSNDNGIVCGNIEPPDCNEIYTTPATVVLTAIPSEHSNFTKWKGCLGVSGSTCTVLMTAARSVKAIYTADPKYTLTVTKAGTGTGMITSDLAGMSCPGDCSKRYWKNDVVTLTAEPDASSMFSGWRGACTGTEKTCRVTLTAAMKVKATFMLATPFLQGNWFLGGSNIQGAHTWDGMVTVSSTGEVTSGTMRSSEGLTYTLTGGNFTISSAGEVTGAVTDSDGITTAFTMQMDKQKGIMAGEGNATAEDGLFVFVKQTPGFTIASLQGNWFLGGSNIQGAHTWDGMVTVSSTGEVTSGTMRSSEGLTYTLTGGNFTISSAGEVTGAVTDSDGITTAFTMQMDKQKGIMAGEGNATAEDGLFVFVKQTPGFTIASLQGNWFLGGSNIQGAHTWDGMVTVSSTGEVTSGTMRSSEGLTYTLTGGNFTISSAGEVTGAVTDSDGITTAFTMQMDKQKGIMAGEGNATAEDGLFVFVKQ